MKLLQSNKVLGYPLEILILQEGQVFILPKKSRKIKLNFYGEILA